MPAEAALRREAAAEEAARRTLRERAAVLARPLPVRDLRPQLALIVLDLGGERAGIPVDQLAGAFEVGSVVALPGVPAFILGLVVHRAEVLPLIDLRPLLGLGQPEGRPARAVVAVCGASTVALAADAVTGPVSVAADDLVEARADLVRHPGLRGIASGGLLVLDVPGLLNDARLAVHQQPPTPVRRQGNSE